MNLPQLPELKLSNDLTAPCLNQQQYVLYGENVQNWKTLQKALTEQRLEQTRPLDASKKKIMKWFQGPLDLLENAIKQRTAAMLTYKQTVDAANRAAEQLAAEKGEIIINAPVKADDIHYRDTWKFEITDETLIPREYLTADTVKIGQAVRLHKECTAIPGVKVFCEKSTVIKTNNGY